MKKIIGALAALPLAAALAATDPTPSAEPTPSASPTATPSPSLSAGAEALLNFKYDDEKQCRNEGTAIFPRLVAGYVSDDPNMKRTAKDAMELALQRGCDINETDAGADYSSGLNALQNAILFGDPELVEWLISKGADPKRPVKTRKNEFADSAAFATALVERWQTLLAREPEPKPSTPAEEAAAKDLKAGQARRLEKAKAVQALLQKRKEQ